MSDAGSDAESAPPPAAGQATPASSLRQQGLWGRTAASGASAKKKTPSNSGDPPRSVYAPISMLELELRTRNAGDGASSAASDDEDEDRHKRRKRRREKKPAARGEGDEDDEDDEDEVDGPRKRRPTFDEADMMASAAFGMPQGSEEHALSVISDSEDSNSVTSSQMLAAQRNAFPVSGVTCVGCAMSSRVSKVDDFVHANCSKMNEVALFKMAALHYKLHVADPARAEGVIVPNWAWKDVRSHYQLHVVDPKMQRYENTRTLGAVRKVLELQLLRQDESTGEQMLDRPHFEALMKTISAQSRELTFLNELNNASSQAAPSGTPGKSKK